MRQWRVGILSMGLLLIALGVIMIFARINGISAIEHIINWWPVILIILGLEILIYSFFSKSDNTMIRFDGLSIFMIIVIIVFSLGAYGITSILNNVSGFNVFNGLTQVSQYNSTFKKKFSISAKNKEKFIVNNRFGSVQVEEGTGENIEVEANITIQNNDEEYAKKVSDLLIEISEGSTVEVETKRENFLSDRTKVQNISTNYTIKLPEGIKVEVDNEFGEVIVEDTSSGVKIQNKHGEVTVKDIGGDLYIDNSFAKVDVDGIDGNTEIHNKNGTVTAKNIADSLIAENSFGAVEIRDVKGDARVINNNGKVSVEIIRGDLVIDSRFCQIDAGDINGSLEVKGNNGSIHLKDIGGDVNVNNKFGNIELIDANKLINLTNSNGSIKFRSSELIEKDVNIENQNGSITIGVPKEQRGYYKANTQYGKIYNDFNLNIGKDSNEEILDQKVGDDKVSFNLRNRNGDIKIAAD